MGEAVTGGAGGERGVVGVDGLALEHLEGVRVAEQQGAAGVEEDVGAGQAEEGPVGHGRLQTRSGFATLRRCGNILRIHQLEEGRPRMEERLQRATTTHLARVSEDDEAE